MQNYILVRKIFNYLLFLVLIFLFHINVNAATTEITLRVISDGTAPLDTNTYLSPDKQAIYDASIKQCSVTSASSLESNYGEDNNLNNCIVRNGDSVTYRVEQNLNQENVPNARFTLQLSNNQEIQKLPSVCLVEGVNPISSISADKSTIICNVGFQSEGQNIIVDIISKVKSSTLNNSLLTAEITSATADGATNLYSPLPDQQQLISTANAKFDLRKSLVSPTFPTIGRTNDEFGNPGYVLTYSLAMVAEKGSEAPAQTNYNIVDYLEHTCQDPLGTPAGNIGGTCNNVRLYTWGNDHNGCGLNGDGFLANNNPFGRIGIQTDAIANNSVSNSGTINCTQSVAGEEVHITINGLDNTFPSTPYKSSANAPLTLGESYFFSGYISFWVPISDIQQDKASDIGSGGTSIVTTNTVRFADNSFIPGPLNEPTSLSGIPNYSGVLTLDNTYEPFSNNSATKALTVTYPGSTCYHAYWSGGDERGCGAGKDGAEIVPVGGITTDYADWRSRRLGWEFGSSNPAIDNIVICGKVNTNYYTFNRWSNFNFGMEFPYKYYAVYGGKPYGVLNSTIVGKDFPYSPFTVQTVTDRPSFGLVDPDHLLVVPHPHPSLDGQKFADYAELYDPIIEYNTLPIGTNSETDLFNANCNDSDGNWSNILPSDPSTITSIRIKALRPPSEYGSSWNLNFSPEMKVLDSTPVGTLMSTYMKVGFATDSTFSSIDWSYVLNDLNGASLNPADSNFAFNAFGIDRIEVVGADLEIAKTTVPYGIVSADPGEIIEFTIISTLTQGLPPLNTNDDDILFWDILPSGQIYQEDSFVCTNITNDQVVTGPIIYYDTPSLGQTRVEWTIEGMDPGEEVPTCNYKVMIDPELVVATLPNTVYADTVVDLYSTTNSVTYDSFSTVTIKVLVPGGYQIKKKVLSPVQEVNTPIDYEVSFTNLSSEIYGDTAPIQFIDVIPYANDYRNPQTSVYTGTYSFLNITQSSLSETFEFTSQAPSLIVLDPCDITNAPLGSTSTPTCSTLKDNNIVPVQTSGAVGTGATIWCSIAAPFLDSAFAALPAGCPHSLQEITGLRATAINALPIGGTASMVLTLKPTGNLEGETYTNDFSSQIPENSLPVISNDVTQYEVDGTLSGFLCYEIDDNGICNPQVDLPIGENLKVDATCTLSLDTQAEGTDFTDGGTGVVSITNTYTTFTDINSEYLFTGLNSGDCIVTVDMSDPYTSAILSLALPANDYDDPTVSSIPNVTDNEALCVLTRELNQDNQLIDVVDLLNCNFGYIPAMIGDFVWHDTNYNGIQDPGELPASGVTVNLYRDGVIFDTRITDPSGYYEFLPVNPYTTVGGTIQSNFYIEFILPSGYTFTLQDTTTDDLDSDADPLASSLTFGRTPVFTLAPSEQNLTLDAGIYLAEPAMDIRKTVKPQGTDAIIDNADGTYTVTFQLEARNLGNMNLTNVDVRDDLNAIFGTIGNTFTVDSVSVSSQPASNVWIAINNSGVIEGDGNLLIGESVTIDFTMTFTPADDSQLDKAFENIVILNAETVLGPLEQDSDTETVDFDNYYNIDVEKMVDGEVTIDPVSGNILVPYMIEVINNGEITVTNVALTENLSTTFTGLTVVGVTEGTANTPTKGFTTGTGTLVATIGTSVTTTGNIDAGSIYLIPFTVELSVPTGVTITNPYLNTVTVAGNTIYGLISDTDIENVDLPTLFDLMEVDVRVIGDIVENNDGSFTYTYELEAKNLGEGALYNVLVTDDLSTTFATAQNFTIDSITAVTGPSTAWAAPVDTASVITATGDLLVGESAIFQFTVTVLPTDVSQVFTNTVTMDAVDVDSNVIPQVNDVEDTSFNNYSVIDVDIRQLGATTNNGDGTYNITYEMQVFNDGNLDLYNVNLIDDVTDAFPVGVCSIVSLTMDSQTGPLSGSITGSIVEATGDLLVGESYSIVYTLVCDLTGDVLNPYTNTVDVTATDAYGTELSDTDTDDVNLPVDMEVIDIKKRVVGAIVDNTDGTFTLTYELEGRNLGNMNLQNVVITDDLNAVYGAGNFTVDSMSITQQPTSASAWIAPINTAGVITATGNLDIDDKVFMQMTLTVSPISLTDVYSNVVTMTAEDDNNAPVPQDTDVEDVNFDQYANIEVDKRVDGEVLIDDQTGNMLVEYVITLKNLGQVDLANVVLTEDLSLTFPGLTILNINEGTLATLSQGFTLGGGTLNAVIGNPTITTSGYMDANSEYEIPFTVELEVPTGYVIDNPYQNDVSVIADAPYGPVTDSDIENVDLPVLYDVMEVDKRVVGGITENNNGSFTFTYEIEAKNLGEGALYNVLVTDDLNTTFASAQNFTVDSITAVTGPSTAWAAPVDTASVITATGDLLVGENAVFQITVTVLPTNVDDLFINIVTMDSEDVDGNIQEQVSDMEDISFNNVTNIDIEERLVGDITSNNVGVYAIPFEIEVTNNGQVDLTNVLVTDDLLTNIGLDGNIVNVTLMNETGPLSGSLTGYVFTATGNMLVDETYVVQLLLEVEVDDTLVTILTNPVDVVADSPYATGDVTDADTETFDIAEEIEVMDIKKQVLGGIISNSDGTFDLTYRLTGRNLGSGDLQNVQIIDDLTTVYGTYQGATEPYFDIISGPTVMGTAGWAVGTEVINNAGVIEGNGYMAVGENVVIEFTLRVKPSATTVSNVHSNTATMDAEDVFGHVITQDTDTEDVNFENYTNIDIDTRVDGQIVIDLATENYFVPLLLTVENNGTQDLYSLDLTEVLSATFPGMNIIGITEGTANVPAQGFDLGSGTLLASYNATDVTVNGDINANSRYYIPMVVELQTPTGYLIVNPYQNDVAITSLDPYGNVVQDTDIENINLMELNDRVYLQKRLLTDVQTNNDGTYDITYEIEANNTGNSNLKDVDIRDDLSAAYGIGGYVLLSGPTIIQDDHGGWTVNMNGDIVEADGDLYVGESIVLQFRIRITPDNVHGLYVNMVSLDATDQRSNPIPTITDTETISFYHQPAIDVDSFIADQGVTPNVDGTLEVPYVLVVKNTGDMLLEDLSLLDDIAATFGTGAYEFLEMPYVSVQPASNTLTLNTDFGNKLSTELLASGQSLEYGEWFEIRFKVKIPSTSTTPTVVNYKNEVSVAATSVTDLDVEDTDSVLVSTQIGRDGAIDVNKILRDMENQGNGKYEVTYEIKVKNPSKIELSNIQIEEDLDQMFGRVDWKLMKVWSDGFDIADDFTGEGENIYMLEGGETIGSGKSESVFLRVEVEAIEDNNFINEVKAEGYTPQGEKVTDDDEESLFIFADDECDCGGTQASLPETGYSLTLNYALAGIILTSMVAYQKLR